MENKRRPRIIFIGGFLGSGKTTLVWEASRRLMVYGQRVGVITNDQAPDLVDTALLRKHGLKVEEVTGSCFCCNFFGLLDATKALKTTKADVLLAEPVGSCTDLAATLMQPMRELFSGEFIHSPLTVLADPARLNMIIGGDSGDLNEYTAYICRMQLEEADIIAINKIDLLDDEALAILAKRVSAEFPHADVRFLSARYGMGIDGWLDEVINSSPGLPRIVDVDYDTYTKGEMSLGWYNAEFSLFSISDNGDWAALCLKFLETLQTSFEATDSTIGHIKLLLSTENGYLVGNVTGFRRKPDLRVAMDESAGSASMTVNARVEMQPAALKKAISTALLSIVSDTMRFEEMTSLCKKPGKPEPTYRYR